MKKDEQYITLKDKRKLGYAEYGKIKGYPIIYCHGSQSSRLEMHYNMSFAFENNLRIITIDRPGHGISDFNSRGSILDFARDAKELIEYLKINEFSVAGMSAGSPFALAISYLFPKNVHKTAIIGGFIPFNTESKSHLSKEVKLMLNLAKSFPLLLKILLKVQVSHLNKNPRKALRGFLNIMGQPDQEILKNDAVMEVIENMFLEAFRNGSKGVAYEISNLLVREWDFKLSEIRGPLTIWQGQKDKNVPFEWAQILNRKIKNSKLIIFPEEGHLILFQHAQEIFSDLKANIA